MNALRRVAILEVGFASTPPNTIAVFGTEIQTGALPKGVQVAAFEGPAGVIPAGIEHDQIVGVQYNARNAADCCDVVFRVESDKELADALGQDLQERLEQQGFETHLWLLHAADHKYTYAYVRSLERHHE
ncbi:hypothetical protein D3C71_1320650 [compost metagenome]